MSVLQLQQPHQQRRPTDEVLHLQRSATTTATVLPGRQHRRRAPCPKDFASSIASFPFAEHFKLASSIPPFSLSPPPSPPSASVSALSLPLPLWTTTPSWTNTAPTILRDEPTRIQLQRQRLRELHNNALLTNKFPGFKTSAAFFASLRTNLRLSTSPPPSPMSTPPSMRASAASLPPASPAIAPEAETDAGVDTASEINAAADDPLAGVPELTSYHAESEGDKIAALKLVADSMAQMRQSANSHLITHPLLLPVVVAILALFARIMTQRGRDIIMIGMGCTGLLMAFFAACRFATQAYLNAAEDMTWEWLGDADVLVTKFGEEIIGTVIIEWVSGESRQKRKKAWKGEIKAWTVRLKYRHKGVGSALLEDAVQEAKQKGAETLEFAEHHANALRPLPQFFNKPFDKRDALARVLLADLYDNSTRSKRR